MNDKTVSHASDELGGTTSRTLDLTIHDEECGTVDSGSTTVSGVTSSPKNIEDEAFSTNIRSLASLPFVERRATTKSPSYNLNT